MKTKFAVGERVETLIAAPHPAAFTGTVLDISANHDLLLIRGEDVDEGFERVYTTKSVRKITD